MTPEQLLKLSSKAGRILLESGAEIQRTEDTICRLCQSFGVEEASAFVIPTGMFLSQDPSHQKQLTESGKDQSSQ